MKKTIILLFMSLLINGCATIGMGAAEVTGVALFNDRRSAQNIVLDEKIESAAMIALNMDSTIRENSHFNVTSYNRIVLVTGETPVPGVIPIVTRTIQSLSDIRDIKNQMLHAVETSISARTNDSMITVKLKTALTNDRRLAGFDTTRIKVVTENSRVFLMGLVYREEADIVSEIAQQQPGVQEVIKVFEYLPLTGLR